jgi:hypothetical protein
MDRHQQSQKNKRFKPQHNNRYRGLCRAGAAACPHCGVCYQDGNLTWTAQPTRLAENFDCPACRAIADNAVGRTLQLSGKLLREHLDEVLSLIKHTVVNTKAEHALERTLKVQADDHGVEVTTTGMHLANRIAHALL